MNSPACLGEAPTHAGCQLITDIHIENFRCYRSVDLKKCSRINAVVGSNGVGKTALLEAVFLALGSSPEIGTRYRGHRGLDASITGNSVVLDRALWNDLFFQGDMQHAISIQLKGDGKDRRSVKIAKNVSKQRVVPIGNKGRQGLSIEAPWTDPGGLRFTWTDAAGHSHPQVATVNSQGVKVDAEGAVEQPIESFFYVPSTANVGSVENASRFSELSIAGGREAFVSLLNSEYPWIKDLSIQINAGAGVIYATVDKPLHAMRPLGYVSGGINKIVSILLCVASVRNGVVLVDEIENGIHHSHHAAVWRMLLTLTKAQNTQSL